MRRRLLLISMPLLAVLFLAISVPAASAIAGRRTAHLVNDRTNDAARFSAAALDELADGDMRRLGAEFDHYAELFDTPLWLLDRERTLLYSADGTPPTAQGDRLLDGVLSGQTTSFGATVWPWGPDTITLAAPAGRDSQVIAAIVMEVPTGAVRTATWRDWGILAAALTAFMAVALYLLWPMSRWLLRPVAHLAHSADAVARGDLRSRAVADAGPPELRGLSQTFNRMVDTVATTLERQQQFVTDASHQLRNPLASARIAVENLRPYLDGGAEAELAYRDALADMDRMSALVGGLLTASSLQAAPVRASSVAQLLERRAQRWRVECAERDVTLVVDVADAEVIEPSGGLAMVLGELLGNALRLAAPQRIELRGRVSEAGRYTLTVADDGVGLSGEEHQLATGRFWRSPRVQNLPGTGLGLNIVAQVVTDVGGRLTLRETPGGGLTVVLDLPLADS
ncbi:HAMP domain-containing histidine kinase [Micromonospora zingiberis]|uniref:Signal transduction histidine-protein kinase/phosphatase MprB n=1 Tax=Micromonospora zingiberis TaxID=2053011 RepID=A0A4R0GNG5_9ACTN|nr:HAMP domain-containing sensor histidine kinase [Micromonospora zingiberis]TCB98447.1 HAMP domain-containing histidine kinase [Micromonospora zingiberis]